MKSAVAEKATFPVQEGIGVEIGGSGLNVLNTGSRIHQQENNFQQNILAKYVLWEIKNILLLVSLFKN